MSKTNHPIILLKCGKVICVCMIYQSNENALAVLITLLTRKWPGKRYCNWLAHTCGSVKTLGLQFSLTLMLRLFSIAYRPQMYAKVMDTGRRSQGGCMQGHPYTNWWIDIDVSCPLLRCDSKPGLCHYSSPSPTTRKQHHAHPVTHRANALIMSRTVVKCAHISSLCFTLR